MSLSLKPQATSSRLKAGHESGFIVLIARVHVFKPSLVKYNPPHLRSLTSLPFCWG